MAEGVAREGFDADLSFGEARESAFVQTLRDCKVECKSDQKARVTGRVFVETWQKPPNGEWRKSGINVTTAQWWAVEVDDDCWIVMRKARLKALARAASAAYGGDEDRYRGRLIPIEWLVRRFRTAA